MEKNGLLVPVDDETAACEAVFKIFSDKAMAARLTSEATSVVLEKYNSKRVASEHAVLFEMLVKKRG